MESPICVTDARTFIDHIHEIKSWLYNGQLRLIIPSSLPENVEVLYNKSKELKPSSKEVNRPKTTLGKPAKKEYPTFDANPAVAKEFLARLEYAKVHVPGNGERPHYLTEENHVAVHFARQEEQYSAWKDVEDYEERSETPTGVESWAEKLKRKQIIANGNAEDKPKGPVKPKLVAKTTADNQPWKVQKNAPTISGLDVPVPLRPMMSCCLWRIHESIHRNDENQIFVLTSQASTSDVAKKLNIIVRSTKDIASILEEAKSSVDLDTFGGVEREFGAGPQKERHVLKCTAVKGSPLPPPVEIDQSEAVSTNAEEKNKETAALKAGTSSLANACGTSNINPYTATTNDWKIASLSGPNTLQNASSQKDLKQVARASEDLPKVEDGRGETTKSNGSKEFLNGASSRPPSAQIDKRTNPPSDDHATNATLEKAGSIETSDGLRSFAQALGGDQVRKPSPAPVQHMSSNTDLKHGDAKVGLQNSTASRQSPWAPIQKPVAVSLSDPSPPPAVKTKAATPEKVQEEVRSMPLPSKADPAPLPATAQDANDSPDSDEEVVVFQPKRLSAQRKSLQQTSRPTTPNVQAGGSTGTQTTPNNVTSAAVGNKRHTTPRQKPNQIQSHAPANPRVVSAPAKAVVIDPDAFGRDFAVNTNPNGKGSLRGTRPRHSPQPSLFDAGTNQARPGSSHRQQRISPERPSPKPSPKQPIRNPAQPRKQANQVPRHNTPPTSAPKAANPPEQKPLPIGSGRPSGLPARSSPSQPESLDTPGQSLAPLLPAPTLNANAPVFQPGNMSNAFLSSPSQPERAATKSTTPTQPPIGSGRPSSKTSQQKLPEATESPLAQLGGEPEPAIEARSTVTPPAELRPPSGPRNPQEASFARRGNPHHPLGPRGHHPNFRPTPQGLTRANLDKHNMASPAHRNGNPPPQPPQNGDFQAQPSVRGRGGGGGPNMRPSRPVKPSLFDPELDTTRAFQSEAIEPQKTDVSDVKYVLKSGSTREQARGKGKLWIG